MFAYQNLYFSYTTFVLMNNKQLSLVLIAFGLLVRAKCPYYKVCCSFPITRCMLKFFRASFCNFQ